MIKRYLNSVILVTALYFLTGCATFRSDLHGAYKGEVVRNSSKPVSVLFHFTHVKQTIGYDAIPKVTGKFNMTRSFDDLFHDSQREFSNLGKFATFTDDASDLNRPERRNTLDSLKSQYDYTIKIRMVEEHTFTSYFFAGFVSSITATIIPAPYNNYFRMETEVYNREGKFITTYKREVTIAKWVELFLVFAYPFCPEDQRREEAVLLMLHDTFKQMEAERVLVAK